ncbi:hypothetical protein C0585_01930 [Candidatus Woesearchaeota archaeon]|nr:MAG: hypothetical protein C0585_01930 [Candidatus Woesearchaeota archaeon]
MREYKTSMDFFESSSDSGCDKNLLEQILSDAKPLVKSTRNVDYDINSRPTELSSGGYVDITD